MRVTVLLFYGLLLGLVAADWKNDIPPAGDFDESAKLCKLVWEVNSFKDLEKADDFDFEPVAFEESVVDTEVAIVRSHRSDSIIVGFRGTNEVGDFSANADISQTDYFGLGLVHQGYKDKLLGGDLHIKLKNDILAELQDFPDYGVTITGHSQGAALATLFGAWLVGTNQLGEQQRVTAFPFGSPRVGNQDFKESVSSLQNYAVYRVVNEEDIVCRWPANFLNYEHVGHLILVDFATRQSKAFFEQTGDGDKFRGVSTDEWQLGNFDRWRLAFNWRDSIDWFLDHDVRDYIGAIQLSMGGDISWPTGFEEPIPVVPTCRWWFWC
uniref:Fungal lipase-type domain-containing protein n=1 Tax=Grammatophora oceanica TaxID=210454 RepID=A0A7S1VT49_9STRA